MTLPGRVFLATRRQLLESELAHSLQHGEARLPAWTCFLSQQALVQERGDALERVDHRFTEYTRDGLRRLQREPTDEDREASEQRLLLGRQQVVAPGDGRTHRLLPLPGGRARLR